MNDYLNKSVVAAQNATQVDASRAERVYIMTKNSAPYQKGDMLVATGSGVEKINAAPEEKEHDEKMLELSALGKAVFGLEPDFDSMAEEWQGFAFEYDDGWQWIPHSQLAQTSGVSIGVTTISYACPYMNKCYAITYWNKGGRILPEDYRTTGNRKNHLVGVKKLDMSINKIGNTKVEYQQEVSADYAAKVGTAFPTNHIGFVGAGALRYANFENVNEIPSYGMQQCSSLQYVRCDKLAIIGGNTTFSDCYSLSVLDFSRKPDDVIPKFSGAVNNTFKNCAKNTPLQTLYVLVPERLLDAWTNTSVWISAGQAGTQLSNINIVSALPE